MPIAAATGRANAHIAAFSYGDLALRVEAAAPETLEWLKEFLGPAFAPGADGADAVTVRLHEDDAAYDAALAAMPADAARLDCFVNDSHTVRLPVWASAAGTRIALQEPWRVLYAVDRDGSVSLISRAGTRSVRTALMRTVRELAMNHAAAGGGLFLHAAALARGGRGLLVAGEKNAGKTTLLLHLLRESGADYVANDRVVLASAASAAAARVRAMPTIVALRAPTLARFPDIAADVAARGFHYRRSLAEAAARRQAVAAGGDGSMGLSPAQLCAILGVRAVAGCVVRAILFPRITGEVDGFRLRQLAPAEAARRLRRAWLSANLAKRTSDLFVRPGAPPAPDDAHLAGLGAALLERVAAYDCALGPNAYADGALAEACLRRLAP